MTEWLQCPQCDHDLFESNEGLFSESDDKTCQECGTISWISVDEDQAYVSTADEVEDHGQPRCDGRCGAVAEFIGKPCLWNCPRTGLRAT